MNLPPDYIPEQRGRTLRLADYVPYGASSGGSAPGRPWNQASKPLSSGELQKTFGATGTVNFAGLIVGDEYVPELEGDRAIATYDRMWRSDGQCAALMNVYLLPLLQATYSINAASDDADAVAQAQTTSDNLLYGMTGITWHRFLRQLYLFRGIYGHAVFEKCWVYDAEQQTYMLRKLAPRLPKTLWRWYPNDDDELDRIQQRVWVQNADGITGGYFYPFIPAQKLLVSTRNQLGDNFLGTSLYRACYKHWYYKDQLYAIDGVAAAKNAIGVPVISETMPQPDRVIQQSDRQYSTNALQAYQANERLYFYMTYGHQFDLKAVSGAVRNIMPSIEHHDLLMARSFLAQFINVDSGGTLIAARDASSFFLQALMGEALEVGDDINPVIREMEQYRDRRRQRYSTLQMQDLDQRDMESYLRGISALLTAGGLTPGAELENALRDNLDLPELPAAATPAGGGVPTVDSDSQAAAVEDPDDKQARQDAATPPDGGPDVGGDAGEVGELRRWERARVQLARQATAALAARTLHSRSRGLMVTVPQRGGKVLELHRNGRSWERYARQPGAWGGVTLPAKEMVG